VSANARHFCISAVISCLRGEDLQAALNRTLAGSGLPDGDKKLVTRISYGYLRYKTRIDFILSRMVKGKLKKLPFPLVVRMGLAVFELHHLERVPEYATVHWYVEEVKKRFSPRMGKLANAVLREVLRWGEAVNDPQFYWHGTSDRASFLARYYACPGWIVRLWREAYGDEACRHLLQASLHPPHTGVRVNRTLPEAEAVYASLAQEAELTLPHQWAMALSGFSGASLADLEASGQISRQSVTVQLLLAELRHEDWPRPVWDACAGRGGKTTALLEAGVGPVWASDLGPGKLQGLRSELSRLFLPPVPCFAHDAAAPHCLKRPAGTVLLDVPCSGLGVLSRRPDTKHKRTPRELERLGAIQQNMVRNCLQALCLGGRLIYVTCTLNPGENEEVVRDALEEAGGELSLERALTPSFPGMNEFFYAAVLRRSET